MCTLAAGLALWGCAGRPAAPASAPAAVTTPPPAIEMSLDDVAPLVVAGETITWELTYMGIEGGRARFAVGEPGLLDGRRVIGVVAEAESSGLFAVVKQMRDAVSTWIELESGLPISTENEATISGNHLLVKTSFRRGQPLADLRIWWKKQPERRVVRPLPARETYDPLSALLVLRAWSAPDGARTTFHALGGQRLWRTDLVVEARETIRSPLGQRRAIRMSGVSTRLTPSFAVDARKPPRTFTLWLSDDARRTPLRLVARTEYGDVEIVATSHAP